MATIASITNGEAMSSVRTKLNDVITEINLLDPTGWVDYSATSTIVGWSSFTTKQIRYRIIGKQLFVMFNLQGTSNSTSVTFTLPNNQINQTMYSTCWAVNNGAVANGTSIVNINANTCLLLQNGSGVWTASGGKQLVGQFFIEIA
jgi:hypothetical protein